MSKGIIKFLTATTEDNLLSIINKHVDTVRRDFFLIPKGDHYKRDDYEEKVKYLSFLNEALETPGCEIRFDSEADHIIIDKENTDHSKLPTKVRDYLYDAVNEHLQKLYIDYFLSYEIEGDGVYKEKEALRIKEIMNLSHELVVADRLKSPY